MPQSAVLAPDRYNALGEWKPLFYSMNSDAIRSRAVSLSSDPDVQGTLLYVFATGKLVLEYVVRTTLRLPVEQFDFGDGLHLWLCPVPTGTTYGGRNVNIYDGWLNLQAADPTEVEDAIENIRRTMNRMAFAFDATVDWRVKYTTVSHMGGSASPALEDMPVLQAILSNLSVSMEDAILDAAIDWYNIGSTSSNPFVSFLCYYIAVESLANAIVDGEAEFGIGYSRTTRRQRREERAQCIQALHDDLYCADPLEFVRRSYFDCVVGLTRRLREVCELVFGPGHPHISVLLERTNGDSLASIRSQLAHGRVTSGNQEDQHLVSSHLDELRVISRDFLNRVIASSRSIPPTSNPMWSQTYSLGISMSDPRAILITSDPNTIVGHNWTIRPEWCD